MSRRDRVLIRITRRASPVALLTLATFTLSTVLPATVRADPAAREAQPQSVEPSSPEMVTLSPGGLPATAQAVPNAIAAPPAGPVVEPIPTDPLSLPTGEDKSGVTSQAISIPKGSGTIKGMDESFSTQLSTGIATFSLPFSLPRARGAAQPALALAYSSASGFGNAGVGWNVSVPFIARQTDRGIPKYQDGPAWHPERDRFVFNGGQEFVPICVVGDPTFGCSGRLQPEPLGAGEELPVWATTGWEYYRARVEGSFLRFFWSPDRRTWRVQSKSGVTMELGVPLSEPTYEQALERNPEAATEIHRWHLVRQYDTYGNANPASGAPAPVNGVVYRYKQDAGTAYLTDIYDTTPLANPTSANVADYAHHTRLVWTERPDPTFSYRSGWRTDQRLRLASVEVSSKTFAGGVGEAFRRVRRYQLAYDNSYHVSLLASVRVEGRCASDEQNATAENSNQTCKLLPPLSFGYSHVKSAPGELGYEDFDEQVRTLGNSPKYSINETLTDLFDVNADALPDVIVTAPALFDGKHGLYLNGVAPKNGSGNPLGLGFTATTIAVSPEGVPPGTDANVLKLTNSNVTPLDLDGDGKSDLVHMPRVKKYEIFSPELSPTGWIWKGRSIATASGQDVKIDFTNDSPKIRVVDVDFDGLVDVVVTTGTELETFFSLGRYPHADGQFGNAVRTGPEAASVSNDPVTFCLPWSASAVQFSDGDIRLADMNGDGITDIVRVRSGDVRYWPGRGNGFWGTGKRNDCPAGTYGQDRHIPMSASPNYQVVQGSGLLLDDVNGDGLADLVEIRFNAVDVYLNVDGVGWTDRHILFNTPPAPTAVNRVRLVDVDGSGTRDILWGDGYDYKYIDLQGGTRPWLLTKFENGLGKTTSVQFTTSTAEMIAATKSGDAWTSTAPVVAHVVKSVTESDGLGGTYTTEYSYRDPVYDGQQREFRGFRATRAKRMGDANSPTDITETRFLLGECQDEDPSNGVDPCSIAERWRDNPREALKGLPVLSERFDESGRYHSTLHSVYTLRGLYLGLDGRAVRHAFESTRETFLYDTATAGSSGADVVRDAVIRDIRYPTGGSPPGPIADLTLKVPVRHANGHAVISIDTFVDVYGNQVRRVAHGCVGGPACPKADEAIESTTEASLPANDPTGWLWRTSHTFVKGDQHTLQRNETITEFNPEGDPVVIKAVLAGTIGIDRFRAGGGSVGSAPSDASNDGVLTIATRNYDAFGNLTDEVLPTGLAQNERCRKIGYDPLYQQLPSSETTFTAGCGSSAVLTTGAAYDRGLGLVTVAVDMNGQPASFGYDELGRLTSVIRPSPEGGPGTTPTTLLDYYLPADLGKSYSAIRARTQDGENLSALEAGKYLESVSLVDGLGRTRAVLSEADPTPSGGDDGDWIVSGFLDFDAKGAVRRKYLQHDISGAWPLFDANKLPSAPYARQRYDAFGRAIQTFDLDGTLALSSVYQALSVDQYDAEDIGPGVHQGTPASTRADGHGRTVVATERFHEGAAVAERETRTGYLPTGETELIERALAGKTEKIVRWMRYDSLGRMVLNVEPNATMGFTPKLDADPTPTTLGGSIRAWRYAYNNQGDLVATSDARGCGVSFAYDGAGRLLGEDYSPCEPLHETYTEANRATLSGFEVLYQYDAIPATPAPGREPPPSFTQGNPPVTSAGYSAGRVVAIWDRAAAKWMKYDARGRVAQQAVRVARPDASPGFSKRYAPRWYQRAFTYDAADRVSAATTGATEPELLGAGAASTVSTKYTSRGTLGSVSGSYGSLVASVDRAADGLLNEIVYGDVAKTTRGFSYDNRRRLKSVQTYRGPPAAWSQPSAYDPPPAPDINNLPTYQLLLQDEDFAYDSVNNPIEIRDWRIPQEWPAGAKPVTRKIAYDDFYRVARVDYQYAAGDDTWTSPYAAEDAGLPQDPRRATPSPHVAFDKRVLSQTIAYDWLGNTAATDDDAHAFYDRSLGTITNDPNKPYQLTAASNKSGPPSARNGEFAAAYDASGNLTRLKVERNGPCLPSGAQCSQIFGYDWDEVGRLVRARRWDVPASTLGTIGDALPGTSAKVRLEYAYDASDQRVLKRALAAGAGPLSARHTVYVFETLELRRAAWAASKGGGGFDYELTRWTEVPYLLANGVRLARVAFDEAKSPAEPSLPSVGGAKLHVLFELGDHLGSTSIAFDKTTSELVERGTYQAYGGVESDYRPERWKSFREDYRFSGKEEDIEVGLAYFGKRFYAPLLQRWISPDPLELHVGGSGDLNLYAYVSGRALRAIDPLGLQQQWAEEEWRQSSEQTAIATGQAAPPASVSTPRWTPGSGFAVAEQRASGPTSSLEAELWVQLQQVEAEKLAAIPGQVPSAQPSMEIAPGSGSEPGLAALGLLGTQMQAAGETATTVLLCPMCAAFESGQSAVNIAMHPRETLEELATNPYAVAKVTGSVAGGSSVGIVAGGFVPSVALEGPVIRGPVAAGERGARLLPAPSGVTPWIGEILSTTAAEDLTMYRVWGGESGQVGSWLSPTVPESAAAARASLALPPGNAASFVSEVTVPAGTRFQIGRAGRAFGQPGGGLQVQLLERIPMSAFGPGVRLR